jgi:hypothetical protein
VIFQRENARKHSLLIEKEDDARMLVEGGAAGRQVEEAREKKIKEMKEKR